MERRLNATETAVMVGCSVQSLFYWYLFKREHPRNKYAKRLPKYEQVGKRKTRYWKESDIIKLIEFKESIPKGRNGVMGDTTKIYRTKEKTKEKR